MERFDEIELDSGPVVEPLEVAATDAPGAPRLRRMAAAITDLSLFVAVAFLLLPLLPTPVAWPHVAALCGFALMLSYYYFVGAWMLWGKTIGGAIFDVRVVAGGTAISFRDASLRWLGLCLSLLTAGAGFLPALLPSRRSLSDRISGTSSV